MTCQSPKRCSDDTCPDAECEPLAVHVPERNRAHTPQAGCRHIPILTLNLDIHLSKSFVYLFAWQPNHFSQTGTYRPNAGESVVSLCGGLIWVSGTRHRLSVGLCRRLIRRRRLLDARGWQSLRRVRNKSAIHQARLPRFFSRLLRSSWLLRSFPNSGSESLHHIFVPSRPSTEIFFGSIVVPKSSYAPQPSRVRRPPAKVKETLSEEPHL